MTSDFFRDILTNDVDKSDVILLGIPLLILNEQNAGLIAIPMVGTMLISIGAMAIYSIGIEAKYRKKK